MSKYEKIDTCKLAKNSNKHLNPKTQDEYRSKSVPKYVNECYCFEPHTKPKLPYKTPSYFEDIYNNIKLEEDEEQYFPNLYASHLANKLKYDPNSKFLKAMKQKAMKNSKYFYCDPEQIEDFEYTLQRQILEDEYKDDQRDLDKFIKNCHKCEFAENGYGRKSPNMCNSVKRTKKIRNNDYFACHSTDTELISISSGRTDFDELNQLDTSPGMEELYIQSTENPIPGPRRIPNNNSWALRYQAMSK